MLGAIIGDIVGSRFEFDNTNSTDFEFFHPDCRPTDDSAMTVAVMATLLEANLYNEKEYKRALVANFKKFYELCPDGDYGLGFIDWLTTEHPQPYNSFGNGACMRVSPCSYIKDSLTRQTVARWTTEVSHNHPYAVHWAVWLAETVYRMRGVNPEMRLDTLRTNYNLTEIDFQLYRPYGFVPVRGVFDETCHGTVPFAVEAVLGASDYVDAVRRAVSFGGDSDTLACITGALAQAAFGLPVAVRRKATAYIPDYMRKVIKEFEKKYVQSVHP